MTQIINTFFLVLIFLKTCIFAMRIERLSFEPPFVKVDYDGSRTVGTGWMTSGSTVVSKNFARLTPDRQNKKGAVYTSTMLDFPAATLLMEFRISGQAKQFFGDGLALWISTQFFSVFGPFHGFSEQFKGVGIIIDTFENTEWAHKDVTVVMNDGTKDLKTMKSKLEGCSGELRFHDKRADFNPESDTAALRVSLLPNGTMNVQISGKGKPFVFRDCTKISLPDHGLPVGWWKDAFITITGTTGQLADNHDVVSLLVSDEADDAVLSAATPFHLDFLNQNTSSQDVEARLGNLEKLLTVTLAKIATLEHNLDHRFTGLDDHITVSTKKLADQEGNLEARVNALEKKLLANVEGHVESKVHLLESSVKKTIGESLVHAERSLTTKLSETVTEKVQTVSGRWKVPFAILLCLMIAAAIAFYRWYQKLKKMHIL